MRVPEPTMTLIVPAHTPAAKMTTASSMGSPPVDVLPVRVSRIALSAVTGTRKPASDLRKRASAI